MKRMMVMGLVLAVAVLFSAPALFAQNAKKAPAQGQGQTQAQTTQEGQQTPQCPMMGQGGGQGRMHHGMGRGGQGMQCRHMQNCPMAKEGKCPMMQSGQQAPASDAAKETSAPAKQ